MMNKMFKSKDLQKAAEDFRYLLNKGYPRKAALELVEIDTDSLLMSVTFFIGASFQPLIQD